MGDFVEYIRSLGVEPRDLAYYRRALTHVSSASSPAESYERLEFLGDSVLGMIVSQYLFTKFPEKGEGDLTRIKALAVSRETLAEIAEKIGVEKFLKVGTARVKKGGKIESSILGDAFEALVGAVFADRGYLTAKRFVLSHLAPLCDEFSKIKGPVDYKSRLQELWQERYKEPPSYEVVSEAGPPHEKEFVVEVRYKGKTLGVGRGTSKRKAEQEAAKAVLEMRRFPGKTS